MRAVVQQRVAIPAVGDGSREQPEKRVQDRRNIRARTLAGHWTVGRYPIGMLPRVLGRRARHSVYSLGLSERLETVHVLSTH